jgi:hypothetical protein
VRCGRCQSSCPGKPKLALIVIGPHSVFRDEMKTESAKAPSTEQTFDRLAAEVALNLAACSKERRHGSHEIGIGAPNDRAYRAPRQHASAKSRTDRKALLRQTRPGAPLSSLSILAAAAR